MSAAARKRMAAAMKARWVAAKKAGKSKLYFMPIWLALAWPLALVNGQCNRRLN